MMHILLVKKYVQVEYPGDFAEPRTQKNVSVIILVSLLSFLACAGRPKDSGWKPATLGI